MVFSAIAMTVKKLALSNFRNIENMVFSACNQVNIIYGDNAQGKTNLIEALWLFTGAKSFRGAKDSEMVALGKNAARLSLSFMAEEREQEARLSFYTAENGGGRPPKKKELLLNGAARDSVSAMMGRFCAVVFSPSHLAIVSEGPGERRRFLDVAVGQVRPVYERLLAEYQKALAQRNALLKDIPHHPDLLDTVELWDERLAKAGASIMRLRMKYIKRLSEKAREVYAGIAGEKERLFTAYQPSVELPAGDITLENLHAALREAMRADIKEDLRAGFTTRGVHRDELELAIDGLAVKTYGSQGQRRSAVLSLKLAECAILEEVQGESPVILLDDVMSELDGARKEYILNHMEGRQVFITCCDSAVFSDLRGGAVFQVAGGRLCGINSN